MARRAALQKLTELQEELGLYDDHVLLPSTKRGQGPRVDIGALVAFTLGFSTGALLWLVYVLR